MVKRSTWLQRNKISLILVSLVSLLIVYVIIFPEPLYNIDITVTKNEVCKKTEYVCYGCWELRYLLQPYWRGNYDLPICVYSPTEDCFKYNNGGIMPLFYEAERRCLNG